MTTPFIHVQLNCDRTHIKIPTANVPNTYIDLFDTQIINYISVTDKNRKHYLSNNYDLTHTK